MDGDWAVSTQQRHAWNATSGQKRWSRGRIVSALLLSAAGGCHPSVEPPNPDGTKMGRPALAIKRPSQFDTALHRRQRLFMKGSSWQNQQQAMTDQLVKEGLPISTLGGIWQRVIHVQGNAVFTNPANDNRCVVPLP
jgi:hypothetical protein